MLHTRKVRRSQGADQPLHRRVPAPGAAQQLVQAAGEGAQVAARARVAQRAQQGAHQALTLRRDHLLHSMAVHLRTQGEASGAVALTAINSTEIQS